jgi:hypothetical protein
VPEFTPYTEKYGDDQQLALLTDFYEYLRSLAVQPFPVHIDLWDVATARSLILDIKINGDVDVTWSTKRPHLRRWGLINLEGGRRYKRALKALNRTPIGLLQNAFHTVAQNY